MESSVRTVLLIVCLVVAVGAGSVVGVPDARITVDELDATPSEPVVGERTSVNVTVANSAGSPDAANVTAVRLLDEDEVRDAAVAPGALSPGDDLDVALRTRFEEPGERRLTVEVLADEPADDDGDRETVRVERDIVVDVQPASVAVDLRARALADDELRTDDEDDGLDVGGIDGIIGGGSELDTDGDDPTEPMDSPVAVTVVNVGTVPAERVYVSATGDPVVGDAHASEPGEDAVSTMETAPFVVEDVAPGEERRVVVDLGRVDRSMNVTLTATYVASAEADDGSTAEDGGGDGSERVAPRVAEHTVETEIRYPPRDGDPVVTDATVTRIGGGDEDDAVLAVDANVGNVGERPIEGVVVRIGGDELGVAPTPAGGEYFVGTVGGGEFVPFELETRANVTTADTVPVNVEYTDRGVRYVETIPMELEGMGETTGEGGGTIGTLGSTAGTGSLATGSAGSVAIVILGVLGATVTGAVLRRRNV
ncbi:CARDB domain-containing protein [Halorubrum luteum]